MNERFTLIASVYLYFRNGGQILLLRRANTGYEDGKYGLVAGHVDGNEMLTVAAAREAREEAGVTIEPADLELKTVMHRRQEDERIDFFFEVKKWEGEITNAEPDKCDDLQFFPIESLPENTIPYIAHAIDCYRKGIVYAEWWEDKY